EPQTNGTNNFVALLQRHRNVILTPHIGGSTQEAQAAIGREVSTKMLQYLFSGSTMGSVNLPSVCLPRNHKVHRIANIHHNVPGVLKQINTALSDYNVVSQMLLTTDTIGYLLIEVDHGISCEVSELLNKLGNSIRTRIL